MKNQLFSPYTTLTTQQVLATLNSSDQGLTEQQVHVFSQQYGHNQLQEQTISTFSLFKNQFRNPFIYLLSFIATIYLFTGQTTEGCIILIIICANSIIGFYQEYHSNKAMQALQKYLQTTISVKRAGSVTEISTNSLVPGDIIMLTSGDIIPADCRFIETTNLVVNEASLTGESLPTQKTHDPAQQEATTIYDAHNIGFTGTIIIDGHATAVVFATGMNTELGSIAHLTTTTVSKSSLSQQTMQLARAVLWVTFISLFILILLNFFFTHHASFTHLLLFSAALAITAIPTALPIVITFCLTKGATALQKHKIIVKRLSSIEDFGGIELLCTDKTGTLTENSLVVDNIYSDNNEQTLLYAALSSEIRINSHKKAPLGFDIAIEQKLSSENKQALQKYSIITSLPFTYERHRTLSLVYDSTDYTLITKGSAEYVLQQCPHITNEKLTEINDWIKTHEMRSSRVLAIATKKIASFDQKDAIQTYDNNYDTIALIAFSDPLKSTALTAVQKAEALNVIIKVLSGDSAYVCFTIAQQLGLESDINNVVLGSDFEKATEAEKKDLAYNRTIFARVTPEQKYQIITYLQEKYSVGYIGDGVNDAPALKKANVGIAVREASPVARQAAEIILLQKSLLNIVLGIEEGRKIIINTLKYITITIASNVGTFYALGLSSLFINYVPMLPLQLLFLDLITDFPLISIATDAVDKNELQKPSHYTIADISGAILLFGFICLPFDFILFSCFKTNEAILQTCWFIESALKQFVLIFALRTKMPFYKAQHPSALLASLCFFAVTIVIVLPLTHIGNTIFHFYAPTKHDFFIIFCIVAAYFITTEVVKLFYYGKNKLFSKNTN